MPPFARQVERGPALLRHGSLDDRAAIAPLDNGPHGPRVSLLRGKEQRSRGVGARFLHPVHSPLETFISATANFFQPEAP